MLVVALTGGIGSGKTFVAEHFARLGVSTIDTDAIARHLVHKDSPAYHQIVKHFGDSILEKSGEINRRALRNLIFENAKDRLWLENLLHPMIRREVQAELEVMQGAYCLVIIPLYFESDHDYAYIDRVLLVDVPEDVQIERVIARDNTNMTAVKKIMSTQVPRKTRLAKADDVIHNNGTVDELDEQVKKLHKHYLNLAER